MTAPRRPPVDIPAGGLYYDSIVFFSCLRRPGAGRICKQKGAFAMAHSEQTLDSRLIFDGKVIRVTLDTVRLENGDTSMR